MIYSSNASSPYDVGYECAKNTDITCMSTPCPYEDQKERFSWHKGVADYWRTKTPEYLADYYRREREVRNK
jgi:hypothetical protein